jgi:hypothetical protein
VKKKVKFVCLFLRVIFFLLFPGGNLTTQWPVPHPFTLLFARELQLLHQQQTADASFCRAHCRVKFNSRVKEPEQ